MGPPVQVIVGGACAVASPPIPNSSDKPRTRPAINRADPIL
jgi:hypothetical protein